MPMNPAGLLYPDILGNRYSRTSAVDISIDNTLIIEGCLGFSVHRKLTRGKSWGHRAKPQARTRGKFECDAKITVYAEDYNLILDYLTSKGALLNQGAFDVAFFLSITLFEQNLGSTNWMLIGCSIADENITLIEEDGDKEIPVPLDLDVMDILKDGISPVLENSPFGQLGA
jgi:hypothetical protein